MLYSDLNYAAKKQAELNVLNICGDEKTMAEILASDFYLFDMDGEIIEENDNY